MNELSQKKTYTVKEFYNILYKGMQTLSYLIKNKRNKQMSNHFIERIMLAVTEVNGCSICSYGHTKIALEQGMTEEEIQLLLSGNIDAIPGEEIKAVMFAQHYADTKGNPSHESWEQVVATYGKEKALGILGATRMIMIGNCYGIHLGALRSRVQGKSVVKSSLWNELAITFSLIPLLPIAVIHALILRIIKAPIIVDHH